MATGGLFTPERLPRRDQNKEHLVTKTEIVLSNNSTESGVAASGPGFSCSFHAMEARTPFRSPFRTPKAVVSGPQIAIVVGPSGEEIWTDKYGRVKVQFHWDREGSNDENSSCWVRVSQAWAGKTWGSMHIPRIGQEVIVDFLEGDPDRPIITGRVYNADNMPPYALPANQTQSGIKSRSTKEGTPDNFNELRFEDKKGEEHVYLQAEKDLQILVKNDESREVGHDRTKDVGHDETCPFGKRACVRDRRRGTMAFAAGTPRSVRSARRHPR
jgi:type VI secretion system secreted protein VgrG